MRIWLAGHDNRPNAEEISRSNGESYPNWCARLRIEQVSGPPEDASADDRTRILIFEAEREVQYVLKSNCLYPKSKPADDLLFLLDFVREVSRPLLEPLIAEYRKIRSEKEQTARRVREGFWSGSS